MAIELIGDRDQSFFKSTNLPKNTFRHLIDVGVVYLDFDFNEYFLNDEYHKKLKVLDKILEAFEIFAAHTKSDITPFKVAYDKCRLSGLGNEIVYAEVFNRKRTKLVKVRLSVDLEKLEVSGSFFDSAGVSLGSKTFFRIRPRTLFDSNLGKVKWIDDETVILFGKEKTECWTINTGPENPRMHW